MNKTNEILLPIIDEIRARIHAGECKRTMAREKGVSYSSFRWFCARENIFKPGRPPKAPPKDRVIWTPEMIAEMTVMFMDGVVYDKIGAHFGVCSKTISNKLKLAGLVKAYVHPPKKSFDDNYRVRPTGKKEIFPPIPWYDFRAWSKGALPGQKFIVCANVDEPESEGLKNLRVAMAQDDTVVTFIDEHGWRWCEKIDGRRMAAQ